MGVIYRFLMARTTDWVNVALRGVVDAVDAMVVMCLIVTGSAEGVRLYGMVIILVGKFVNERLMSTVFRQATFSMSANTVL